MILQEQQIMNSSVSNVTTAVDTATIIQELNDKMARLHIPATVYISVLMVLGFLGNLMVCYYYGFETKKSTNSFFITILAIYDVIVCVISMPTEIVDIVLYYEFTNNVACKILRFVNYCAAIGSILTLIAIATDRFKKICRPTGPQMTFKHAKIVSLCIVGLAVLLAWPSLVIYGSIMVNVPNEYGLDLKGSDCTSTYIMGFGFGFIFNVKLEVSRFLLSQAMDSSMANNTTVLDSAAYLRELNSKLFSERVPVYTVLFIFGIVGVVGNLLTCHFYGFKTGKSTNDIFITALAVYDLLYCAVYMSTEIVFKLSYYGFKDVATCKILPFFQFVTGTGSMLTVTVIAIDRYRRVCRYAHSQFTLRQARICNVGLAAFAVFVSSLAIVAYDVVDVDIPTPFGISIREPVCSYNANKIYRWILDGVTFIGMIVCFCVLAVLYGFIGRVIYVQRKKFPKSTQSRSPNETSCECREVTESINLSVVKENEMIQELTVDAANAAASECRRDDNVTEVGESKANLSMQASSLSRTDSGSDQNNVENNTESRESGSGETNKEFKRENTSVVKNWRKYFSSGRKPQKETPSVDRTTVVMILITVVFIVSFIPYFAVILWNAFGDSRSVSQDMVVVLTILSKSSLLGSCINPLIYGIFNRSFRNEYVRLFRRCCARLRIPRN